MLDRDQLVFDAVLNQHGHRELRDATLVRVRIRDECRPARQRMLTLVPLGQIDIVKAALAHREKLFEATLARAQAEGIDLAFEGDEGDGDGAEYSEEE